MKISNQERELIVNTMRTLSMDAVQQAKSGHPGTPMSLAPVAFSLWNDFMKFNPGNPNWPNRDRFVLSAGHASMLMYSLLHIMGYDVSLDDIKKFRQLHSKTAGHPEFGITPGIEVTTGPLGQGLGMSVGFAIAEKWLKSFFNRPDYDIVDYSIYAVAGDGCMMEGISSEAASLAGHLGLDNLVWLYDNNHITIEGDTKLAFSEDVRKRFESFGWNVQHVDDANDSEKLGSAVHNALRENGKPSLLIVDSLIAFGAPNKQGSSSAHGEPLGEEEIRGTKINYGLDPDRKFYVPPELASYTSKIVEKGDREEQSWKKMFNAYTEKYPALAGQFLQVQNGELPDEWSKDMPQFPADAKGLATRQSNGLIINAIAKSVPWFFGGSADLMPSTKTKLSDTGSFARGNYDNKNIHFGVREHAMGAVVNGMVLSKLRAFGATFFVFSDYMRPAMRIAALMAQPAIYIFTHDSIGLGEDGPTHQPVEHLAALRAMPNLEIIRPADANELSVLWKYIMEVNDHPIALVLSRQSLPTLDRTIYSSADGALRGAYTLADSGKNPEAILMGTGSEIHLCLEAHAALKKEGIETNVVSIPSWFLFEQQQDNYRNSVLPADVKARVAVEAASPFGWHKYTASSDDSSIIGVSTFGTSAPFEEIFREHGLTAQNIVQRTKERIEKS